MDSGQWTVKDTAELLGVSEKSVRRYIQSGKVQAVQVQGKYGSEWRVTAIPADLRRQTSGRQVDIATQTFADLLREKDSRLEELNRLLGAAQLRIGQLENEVKLLESPDSSVQRLSWWRRIFRG